MKRCCRNSKGITPTKQFSTDTPILECGEIILLLLLSYGSLTTAASWRHHIVDGSFKRCSCQFYLSVCLSLDLYLQIGRRRVAMLRVLLYTSLILAPSAAFMLDFLSFRIDCSNFILTRHQRSRWGTRTYGLHYQPYHKFDLGSSLSELDIPERVAVSDVTTCFGVCTPPRAWWIWWIISYQFPTLLRDSRSSLSDRVALSTQHICPLSFVGNWPYYMNSFIQYCATTEDAIA